MENNNISRIIVGKAIEIHKTLGPGLLESAYQECLYYELTNHGFQVEKEKPMPVIYKAVKLDQGYRMDLLVNDRIVLEIKSVESLAPVHAAQILTYMRLGNYNLGLLINFNVPLLKNGIKRYII